MHTQKILKEMSKIYKIWLQKFGLIKFEGSRQLFIQIYINSTYKL